MTAEDATPDEAPETPEPPEPVTKRQTPGQKAHAELKARKARVAERSERLAGIEFAPKGTGNRQPPGRTS